MVWSCMNSKECAEHTALRNATVDIYCGGWGSAYSHCLGSACQEVQNSFTLCAVELHVPELHIELLVARLCGTLVDEQHYHIFDILPLNANCKGSLGGWRKGMFSLTTQRISWWQLYELLGSSHLISCLWTSWGQGWWWFIFWHVGTHVDPWCVEDVGKNIC